MKRKWMWEVDLNDNKKPEIITDEEWEYITQTSWFNSGSKPITRKRIMVLK